MIKEATNKMIQSDEVKTKGEPYFFPEYGVSFVAESIEEANKKLQEFLKKDK